MANISSAVRRRRLLISSSVRWDYLWQRHQAFAVAAAKAGWEVDFLQPRPRNLRQVLTFPFRLLASGGRESNSGRHPDHVNILGLRHWLARRRHYDLALLYIPDRFTELLIHRNSVDRLVYDAVLDWETVPRAWFPPIGWRQAEERIARNPACVVTSDSRKLAERFTRLGVDTHVVPPAADDEFITFPWRDYAEKERSCVYFGSVRAEVDIRPLLDLAISGVPVAVIGSVDNDARKSELLKAGVQVSDPVQISELPALVDQHRIVLLPYQGSRAETLVPAKLWNSLVTGSWVVTTGLSELPVVRCLQSSHTGSVVDLVSQLMDRGPERIDATAAPTWGRRWGEILSVSGAS